MTQKYVKLTVSTLMIAICFFLTLPSPVLVQRFKIKLVRLNFKVCIKLSSFTYTQNNVFHYSININRWPVLQKTEFVTHQWLNFAYQ